MLRFLSNIISTNNKLFSIALVFILFWSNASYSQQIFSGIVKDSVSGQVISFVNIFDENKNEIYVSDQNGQFEIEVNGKSGREFKFSSVGYKTTLFKFTEVNEQNIILLKPAVEKLDEISVRPPQPSKEAKKVVNKSIRELKKNFSISEQSAYFSHRIYENDQCIKITDGNIVFRDNTGYFNNLSPVKRREEIEFTSKRVTLDYSKSDLHFQRGYFDIYNDEFAFLLKNILKYKVSKSKYDFYIDQKSQLSNVTHYEITAFDQKSAGKSSFSDFFDVKYKISYNHLKDTYHLHQVILNYTSSYDSKFFKHNENSFFSISISNNSELMRIQHAILQTNSYDKNSKTLKLIQSIDFENIYREKSKAKINATVKNSSQLVFEKYTDKDKEFYVKQEQMDFEKVNEIVYNNNNTKETYLIFWDNYEQIMPFMGLNNKLDRRKVDLIFIGDIASHKEWRFIKEGMDVKYFYNFNLPNFIAEYLQGKSDYPIFIKYDTKGNSNLQNKPFDMLVQK